MKQTGTDRLARVHRHNRAPAILVAQEVMATFNAKDAKTRPLESGYEVGTGDTGFRSCCDGHALDANELQILLRRALDLKT